MSFSYLKYLYCYLRYPNKRDFLKMGYGIYFRHLRCRAAWEPHLKNSAEFIKSATNSFPDCKELVVLGAGRLLDLDVAWAAERFLKVTLVDADPSLIPVWKRCFTSSQLKAHILDITSSLDSWTEVLQSNPEQVAYLRATAPEYQISPGSLVISLNLLSQLSIYWRDRVLDSTTSNALDFLEGQYGDLQERHLAWLAESKAAGIVIITDSDFEFYRSGDDVIQREPALFGQTSAALGELSDSHTCLFQNSWLWDLAPEGIEQVGYGERHRVVAYCFARKDYDPPTSGGGLPLH